MPLVAREYLIFTGQLASRLPEQISLSPVERSFRPQLQISPGTHQQSEIEARKAARESYARDFEFGLESNAEILNREIDETEPMLKLFKEPVEWKEPIAPKHLQMPGQMRLTPRRPTSLFNLRLQYNNHPTTTRPINLAILPSTGVAGTIGVGKSPKRRHASSVSDTLNELEQIQQLSQSMGGEFGAGGDQSTPGSALATPIGIPRQHVSPMPSQVGIVATPIGAPAPITERKSSIQDSIDSVINNVNLCSSPTPGAINVSGGPTGGAHPPADQRSFLHSRSFDFEILSHTDRDPNIADEYDFEKSEPIEAKLIDRSNFRSYSVAGQGEFEQPGYLPTFPAPRGRGQGRGSRGGRGRGRRATVVSGQVNQGDRQPNSALNRGGAAARRPRGSRGGRGASNVNVGPNVQMFPNSVSGVAETPAAMNFGGSQLNNDLTHPYHVSIQQQNMLGSDQGQFVGNEHRQRFPSDAASSDSGRSTSNNVPAGQTLNHQGFEMSDPEDDGVSGHSPQLPPLSYEAALDDSESSDIKPDIESDNGNLFENLPFPDNSRAASTESNETLNGRDPSGEMGSGGGGGQSGSTAQAIAASKGKRKGSHSLDAVIGKLYTTAHSKSVTGEHESPTDDQPPPLKRIKSGSSEDNGEQQTTAGIPRIVLRLPQSASNSPKLAIREDSNSSDTTSTKSAANTSALTKKKVREKVERRERRLDSFPEGLQSTSEDNHYETNCPASAGPTASTKFEILKEERKRKKGQFQKKEPPPDLEKKFTIHLATKTNGGEKRPQVKVAVAKPPEIAVAAPFLNSSTNSIRKFKIPKIQDAETEADKTPANAPAPPNSSHQALERRLSSESTGSSNGPLVGMGPNATAYTHSQRPLTDSRAPPVLTAQQQHQRRTLLPTPLQQQQQQQQPLTQIGMGVMKQVYPAHPILPQPQGFTMQPGFQAQPSGYSQQQHPPSGSTTNRLAVRTPESRCSEPSSGGSPEENQLVIDDSGGLNTSSSSGGGEGEGRDSRTGATPPVFHSASRAAVLNSGDAGIRR